MPLTRFPQTSNIPTYKGHKLGTNSCKVRGNIAIQRTDIRTRTRTHLIDLHASYLAPPRLVDCPTSSCILISPLPLPTPPSSMASDDSASYLDGSDTPLDDPNDVYAKFTASEMFWKRRQQLLQSHGYMLRPRYRPDWIPSWKLNPTMNILHAEDRLSFRVSRIRH